MKVSTENIDGYGRVFHKVSFIFCVNEYFCLCSAFSLPPFTNCRGNCKKLSVAKISFETFLMSWLLSCVPYFFRVVWRRKTVWMDFLVDCLRYSCKGNNSVDAVMVLAPCKHMRGEEGACMCINGVHMYGLGFKFFISTQKVLYILNSHLCTAK